MNRGGGDGGGGGGCPARTVTTLPQALDE